MTKEELKQEAEEWLCNNLHSASEEDFIKAMVDIAEPREKRIEELEKENELLKADVEFNAKQSTKKSQTVKKYQELVDEYSSEGADLQERIKELEKENAELKKENQKWKDGIALKDEEIGCIETDFNTFKSKSKEIIKTFLGFAEAFGYSPSMDKFITETEQFLSEVEK